MAKAAKRAVSAARKATDKRVVGSAQNPTTIKGSVGSGAKAGDAKTAKYVAPKRSGAGRPKKVK
jgi:hypothetical protein